MAISLRNIFTPISVAINLATGNFVAASADIVTDKAMPKQKSVDEVDGKNQHLFLPKFKASDRKAAQSLVGLLPTTQEKGLGRVYGVNAHYAEMEARNNKLLAEKYTENFVKDPVVAVSAAKVKSEAKSSIGGHTSKIIREGAVVLNEKNWVRELSLEKPAKTSFVDLSRASQDQGEGLSNKLAISQKLSFQAMIAAKHNKEQRCRSAA